MPTLVHVSCFVGRDHVEGVLTELIGRVATIAIVVQPDSRVQNYFSKLQTPINVAQVEECWNWASIKLTFGFIKRIVCDSVNKHETC